MPFKACGISIDNKENIYILTKISPSFIPQYIFADYVVLPNKPWNLIAKFFVNGTLDWYQILQLGNKSSSNTPKLQVNPITSIFYLLLYVKNF